LNYLIYTFTALHFHCNFQVSGAAFIQHCCCCCGFKLQF